MTPDDQRLEELRERAERFLNASGDWVNDPARKEAQDVLYLLTTLRERTEALRELQEAARDVLASFDPYNSAWELKERADDAQDLYQRLSALLPQEGSQ